MKLFLKNSLKKLYIPMSLISGILIYLSNYKFTYKIFLLTLSIIINKLILNFILHFIRKEYEKMELEDIEYLGLNPKYSICFAIYMIFYLSFTFNNLIAGKNENLNILRANEILTLITLLFIVCIYTNMGTPIEIQKNPDEILYKLTPINLLGWSNLLGIRIGKFRDGIIIDRFIFYYNDIWMIEDKIEEYTIILNPHTTNTVKQKIIITDKKAIKYFREILKDMNVFYSVQNYEELSYKF